MPQVIDVLIMTVGDITFSDGLVAVGVQDDKWVITSPNTSWIPDVLLGRVSIAYHADGRFGMADPTQWPQIHSTLFPHFCLMLCKPSSTSDPRLVMWESLSDQDFVPVVGCSLAGFGVVSPTLLSRLRPHVDDVLERVRDYCNVNSGKGQRITFTSIALRDTMERLSHPASFRDMNRQLVMVQRFWQESLAWLTWVQDKYAHFNPSLDDPPAPYDSQFIGAYTTKPAVVQQLFRAGVPVWYLRRPEEITHLTIIRDVIDITLPTLIDTSNPTFTLYSGRIGDHSLAATCMGIHNYSDIEEFPYHNPDIHTPTLRPAAQVLVPSSSLGLAPIQPIPPVVPNATPATPSTSVVSRFSVAPREIPLAKKGKAKGKAPSPSVTQRQNVATSKLLFKSLIVSNLLNSVLSIPSHLNHERNQS